MARKTRIHKYHCMADLPYPVVIAIINGVTAAEVSRLLPESLQRFRMIEDAVDHLHDVLKTNGIKDVLEIHPDVFKEVRDYLGLPSY